MESSVVAEEVFRNVSVDEESPRYVRGVLEENSMLVEPADKVSVSGAPSAGTYSSAGDGQDGASIVAETSRAARMTKQVFTHSKKPISLTFSAFLH